MIFPSSWPQTDDFLVITQIYLSLTPRSDSFSVCKASTPIHLWALHTSIQRHHQVTEGTTRPCCSCQLHMFPTPSMVPGAPFQPTWGWIISLCPSWGLFSSPLSGPATQKSLELSLHIIHLTGGPSGVIHKMNYEFSFCPFLVPLSGPLPWLFICCARGCWWSCYWYLVLPILWACPPWRRHSLWYGHPCPSGTSCPLLHSYICILWAKLELCNSLGTLALSCDP